MTFHEFLQTKYPLYSDTEIKVNLTVSQLLELVEEYISETSPVFEVKVVDAALECKVANSLCLSKLDCKYPKCNCKYLEQVI